MPHVENETMLAGPAAQARATYNPRSSPGTPQGLAVDPGSGQIWATEHGPLGGDELNLIRSALNYGWAIVRRGRDYEKSEPFGQAQSMQGMIDPAYEFPPTLAPSGLALVDSERLLTGEIGRIRDARQGPDGHIYLLTDQQDGGLYRIEALD